MKAVSKPNDPSILVVAGERVNGKSKQWKISRKPRIVVPPVGTEVKERVKKRKADTMRHLGTVFTFGILALSACLPVMEGVGTRQRQAQRSSLILDAAYASPSAVHSQMSDRVLTLEKLSYKVARKPETRAACLEFADALGIGHFGAALANETKVKEFMKKPLGVFPVRDRENRIACGFGFGNATVSSTDSGSTLSDPALTHDATVFVDVEDRVTLNVHSGILAHGLREGKRLGNTRRWLGNETLRSKPEPMKDTFGTGVRFGFLSQQPILATNGARDCIDV